MESYSKINRVNRTITKDGMFYSNFDSKLDFLTLLVEGSDCYSEHLAYLKDNYGLKIGAPIVSKIENNGEMIGVYIVDWKTYIADQNMNNDELNYDSSSKIR